MNSIKNSVQLIGHLGKDPEVRELENGKMVANLSIATNDMYKNSRGEKVIETQWHRAVGWGKTAELIQRLLKKGNEVAIRGKLSHKSYEDKEGITRYYSQVIISEFVKLGKLEVT